MTDDTTITPFRQPGSIIDPLTEIARDGARRMLMAALKAEADGFVAMFSEDLLADASTLDSEKSAQYPRHLGNAETDCRRSRRHAASLRRGRPRAGAQTDRGRPRGHAFRERNLDPDRQPVLKRAATVNVGEFVGQLGGVITGHGDGLERHRKGPDRARSCVVASGLAIRGRRSRRSRDRLSLWWPGFAPPVRRRRRRDAVRRIA